MLFFPGVGVGRGLTCSIFGSPDYGTVIPCAATGGRVAGAFVLQPLLDATALVCTCDWYHASGLHVGFIEPCLVRFLPRWIGTFGKGWGCCHTDEEDLGCILGSLHQEQAVLPGPVVSKCALWPSICCSFAQPQIRQVY